MHKSPAPAAIKVGGLSDWPAAMPYQVDFELGKLRFRHKDALSSLTRRPASMKEYLRLTVEMLAELLANPDQVVHVEVFCDGTCPAAVQAAVMCAVHELVSNAVKHGFYRRLVGYVRVDLAAFPQGTRLRVVDDGWGMPYPHNEGVGLRNVRASIAPFGGKLALRSADGVTAEIFLPNAASSNRGFAFGSRTLFGPDRRG